MLRTFLLFSALCLYSTAFGKAPVGSADTTKSLLFTEGILYTRISFPGNPLNEVLSSIDFNKGDIQTQLNALKDMQTNKAYAEKMSAVMAKMTPSEQRSMGNMMMAVLMSTLYATIYVDSDKALAKAYALNYTLESYMDTNGGNGKMVAVSNDKSSAAAIRFTAASLEKAWQKESADAQHYTIQWLNTTEKVSGIPCRKAIYTLKGEMIKPGQQSAQKLIVWYSLQISDRINFAHPFYLDIPHGVLKIEVHYDKSGKSRMIYEVVSLEQKKLSEAHFIMTDIQPVIDWDVNPEKASINMLTVFMSQDNTGKE